MYLYRLMQHCSAKKLAIPFTTHAQATQPAHQPVVLAENTFVLKYLSKMPKEIAERFAVIQNIATDDFDAVLHHRSKAQLQKLQHQITARSGAIIRITHLQPLDHRIPLERLVIERAISINITAAGGNASLMTLT